MLASALLPTAAARAEEPAILLPLGARAGGVELARRALPRELADAVGDTTQLGLQLAGVHPARLQQLARIETLLAGAREQAAALDEDGALASLAEAADLGAGLGDVPGAAAYNAEVQLRLGVTAAQAGLSELAEIALRRAATLDPGRRLRAGEAPPDVVERAAQLAREVATGPLGALEVRADAAGARVFIDDVDRGAAPARLQLPVGRHVLRVEAPGHVPYGTLIDVMQGQRPPIVVALSPDAPVLAARALRVAARNADLAGVVAAARALREAGVELGALYLAEGSADGTRALLLRCDDAGCRAPLRLSAQWAPGSQPLLHAAPLSATELARARRWLAAGSARRREAARAEAGPGYLWVAAGATLVALAAGAVLMTPERERSLRVVVDPGDVGQ